MAALAGAAPVAWAATKISNAAVTPTKPPRTRARHLPVRIIRDAVPTLYLVCDSGNDATGQAMQRIGQQQDAIFWRQSVPFTFSW
jgi:hypothetical protein